LRVEFSKPDRLDSCCNRGDKRIVFIVETIQYVGTQHFIIEFFLADAISSASDFIFEMYSATLDNPFWEVASVIRALMTLA
jgi:hypothetical protein